MNATPLPETSPALFSQAFEALPLSAAILDDHGRIVAVNAEWRAFACDNDGDPEGYVGGDYLGVCVQAPEGQPRELAVALRELLDGARERVEIEYPCHSADQHRWFLMQASRVDGLSSAYLLVTHTNITKRRLAEEEARRLAEYDALTGLLGRASFQQRLQQALNRAERNASRLAVFFLDLDGFKPVNDELGHEAGDALLTELGRRLHRNLRRVDSLARIGGDEFAFFAEDVDTATARQIAERITATVREPCEVGGRRVALGGSIGISLYPEDGTDAQVLMRKADERMYASKSDRRDRTDTRR